ncbi:hypothetical protein F4678DRAFT_467382 [Xylaria arbuscula]|nr:hypothetical protein F4678DRAFT_467382 [Xylaria arbuscula]
MSQYIHPDVKTLKVIADNWRRQPDLNSSDSPRTNTPHDARTLTRLVSTSSLAVLDPYSERVEVFVQWYHRAQSMDLRAMSDEELEVELTKISGDIDDMFFFSLLRRTVDKPAGQGSLLSVQAPLLIVQVMPGASTEGYKAYFRMDDLSPIIRIWRLSRNGDLWHFETLLSTLLHEMCHAYLELFSDTRHPRHEGWINVFSGHGEMFWVLQRFVSRKIGAYTKSDAWQEVLERGEAECSYHTETRGQPGTWGTPEKTVMIWH